ncbi:tail assembly protein [Mesoterricola silvestris]|uniref:Tail assembly protein n=1 Tax=Mesoterricola silvestris TaxID=2927979 RepID=A0AA48GM70_9BACT|nr:hypothetical protein [Mesoterricola silvestris]BDU72404.1 tail assembly protein [Mesoterricola silvestris]
MKRTILLYGALRKFGRKFVFDVDTTAEAIKALRSQVKGFEAYLRNHLQNDFSIVLDGEALDEEGLQWNMGNATTLKIIPVVSGADGGFLKVVAGSVLIVVGNMYHQQWLIGVGASMALGGVAEMLSANPVNNPSLNSENPTTYSFGSPRVTTGQGKPIPIAYGELIVGGHLISAGRQPESWQTNGMGGMAPDEVGTMSGNGDTSPWVWALAPVSA